jgi:hypothetical protein
MRVSPCVPACVPVCVPACVPACVPTCVSVGVCVGIGGRSGACGGILLLLSALRSPTVCGGTTMRGFFGIDGIFAAAVGCVFACACADRALDGLSAISRFNICDNVCLCSHSISAVHPWL